jgi:hypothetical protein
MLEGLLVWKTVLVYEQPMFISERGSGKPWS